jgi:hypothetical protein
MREPRKTLYSSEAATQKGACSRATDGTHGTYVCARRLISPMCPISPIRGMAARFYFGLGLNSPK